MLQKNSENYGKSAVITVTVNPHNDDTITHTRIGFHYHNTAYVGMFFIVKIHKCYLGLELRQHTHKLSETRLHLTVILRFMWILDLANFQVRTSPVHDDVQ